MITPFLVLLALQTSSHPQPEAAQAPTPVDDVEVVAETRFASVELECRIERGGRLGRCVVLSETPPGRGFGQAALAAARRSRSTLVSSSSGGKVRFTTRFQLQD